MQDTTNITDDTKPKISKTRAADSHAKKKTPNLLNATYMLLYQITRGVNPVNPIYAGVKENYTH